MGGNLKVWVLKFRGKVFGGNIMVYISSGETNTVYQWWSCRKSLKRWFLQIAWTNKFDICGLFIISNQAAVVSRLDSELTHCSTNPLFATKFDISGKATKIFSHFSLDQTTIYQCQKKLQCQCATSFIDIHLFLQTFRNCLSCAFALWKLCIWNATTVHRALHWIVTAWQLI